jgi:hypothetical protein
VSVVGVAVQKVNVAAAKKIRRGEELFFNYGFVDASQWL